MALRKIFWERYSAAADVSERFRIKRDIEDLKGRIRQYTVSVKALQHLPSAPASSLYPFTPRPPAVCRKSC